ncbi:cell division cycle-associated protein 2 isoform X1 [Manis pentadactyla]|uniref:cell division cycle-associated protein 2 isoform X1 n=1 Tax=Manis pentadactyla TaxID=143292 RepID=UPI00255CE5D1|nr:cell division cycle-associated protein 2 isoform X1 [Manis pentadactyla]XP_057342438.1 cell division cycle-associated protein 2 isoform X1 [Manis pentadactyla]
MDTNSKDTEPPETEESAVNNAENASFILGNGKLVTPQKDAEVTPNGCAPHTFKTPLNFDTITVEQLGITPESFVKNPSGKSSSYLKKSRRRSAVGARGSPETNHLIRFIAQQRNLKNAEKSPLAQNSPFQGSPVLYGNVNSLKERISAFQSAFHSITETEKMTGCPEFSEAGELEATGLTKKESLGECQQSEFPAQVPCRHGRPSSESNSDEDLPEAVDLQKSSESGLTQSGCLVEESSPLSELTETSSGVKAANCVEGKGPSRAVSLDRLTEASTETAPDVRALVTPLCRRALPSSETFGLRSVLKKPSVKLFLESLQEHCDNLCDDAPHPSLVSNLANCCKEFKADGQENYKVPAFVNTRKRKRVTFREDLIPEVFDESLPANTPLRKGGTPVRKEALSSISPLLLEQSPVPEQLSQPNFDNKRENLENIEPLQASFTVLSPLRKSSNSETLSGTEDTFSSSNGHEKIAAHKVGRVTRTSSRSQLISFAEESVCSIFNTEAQPCKEKKINRRSQENKRSNKIQPRKNQAVKSCRKKKKSKKSVQNSLYGERDIASKKPLLSPILELPEASEVTPSVPGMWRVCSDIFNLTGELEEVKYPKRENLLPVNPDWQMNQGFNKHNTSECYSSDTKSSSSLINAIFDQDSNTNTVEITENKNIPKAVIKLENENERTNRTKNENSKIPWASVTEKPLVSDNPNPNISLQSQKLSAAGQNVESLFQIHKTPTDIKCEKQDDCLVGTEGKLQAQHLLSDTRKERGCSEDVLINSVKESKSPREDLGRNCTESTSGMRCRERKCKNCSLCYCPGQSLQLEKNGSREPSSGMSTSVKFSLENSELYKDLSDSIEQSFQRTNSETKVRRSSRLREDLEEEGLVWISLPSPSTRCASQRTKRRRTLCALDSRGFESVSPQKPGVPPAVLGKHDREGLPSNPLRNRRKSFCTSTLAIQKPPPQSKCYKRNFPEQEKELSE